MNYEFWNQDFFSSGMTSTMWIFLGSIVFLLFVIYFFYKLRKRQKEIQTIWNLILFFLTKRQMLLPLVITLAKRDDLISKDQEKELIAIRCDCRKLSLQKDTEMRLKMEGKISEVVFEYFSKLEEKQLIGKGTKFEKMAQDFEFIDAKLVQLQQIYNKESVVWNGLLKFPILGLLLSLFGFKIFKSF